MGLLEELKAAAAVKPDSKRSKVEVFFDQLSEQDRADIVIWLSEGGSKSLLWRNLREKGLDVAEVTFRAWLSHQ